MSSIPVTPSNALTTRNNRMQFPLPHMLAQAQYCRCHFTLGSRGGRLPSTPTMPRPFAAAAEAVFELTAFAVPYARAPSEQRNASASDGVSASLKKAPVIQSILPRPPTPPPSPPKPVYAKIAPTTPTKWKIPVASASLLPPLPSQNPNASFEPEFDHCTDSPPNAFATLPPGAAKPTPPSALTTPTTTSVNIATYFTALTHSPTTSSPTLHPISTRPITPSKSTTTSFSPSTPLGPWMASKPRAASNKGRATSPTASGRAISPGSSVNRAASPISGVNGCVRAVSLVHNGSASAAIGGTYYLESPAVKARKPNKKRTDNLLFLMSYFLFNEMLHFKLSNTNFTDDLYWRLDDGTPYVAKPGVAGVATLELIGRFRHDQFFCLSSLGIICTPSPFEDSVASAYLTAPAELN
ncbi:hypothetical protein M422DRAFT_261483 [Sphaerobolus stellatus SS14]|uniref:Uncharacterized protein n=1 Tax=Sphaerobolus stellatus (strain SS14) TaxID=990650 RepID=A0A0C9VEU3_SPHS4|nr:hypothetical protein M422DRAFT_261483 [Sphaerobolus stellatus SS14]